MNLYQKYRPKTWDDVAGQDKPIKVIRSLLNRSAAGRVFWITSNSGQGKSSIAELIVQEAGADWTVDIKDAQDVSKDFLRSYDEKCGGRALGGALQALIINEAHTLRRDAVDYLKTLTENEFRFVRNGILVFTTTIKEQAQRNLFGEDESGQPFLSRAHKIVLNHGSELELAFAIKARTVAQAEGLDGKPLSNYVDLMRLVKCNLREAYQKIEEGFMLD